MPIDTRITHISPTYIQVGDRQRSDDSVSDLIDNIQQYGILVPLIVREATCSDCNGTDSTCVQCDGTGKEIRLVAGRRRLACAIELVLETVPVLFYTAKHETEVRIIELLENTKRRELPWRDYVNAIGQLHNEVAGNTWTVADTATLLNLDPKWVAKILTVYNSLSSPAIADAATLSRAINTLQQLSERRTTALVEDLLRAPSNPEQVVRVPTIISGGAALGVGDTDSSLLAPDSRDSVLELPLFNEIDSHPEVFTTNMTEADVVAATAPIARTQPILTADFLQWSASYSGPKFNLIHCDFVGEEAFGKLTDALTANFDRFASYSAHVMFWFDFERYEESKRKLAGAGLVVSARPLIWTKSDSKGPRSYEACLLAFRGNRQLLKNVADHYAAPTVTSPIHPAQKPEPMLHHFFSMLVDNMTDFLDPTCGSGSALRAAERLNARTVLGLEINPEHAAAANAATIAARNKRNASERLGGG